MKHGSAKLSHLLRLLALAGCLALPSVHADEYGDVNKLVAAGKLAEAQTKADQYLAAKPRDPQMRFIKGVIVLGSRSRRAAMPPIVWSSSSHSTHSTRYCG